MSDAPVFRMNPAINARDYRDYAETFRRDGIVQISNIFEPELADYLEKALKDDTYWRLTYADEKQRAVSLNSDQIAKTDLQALAGEILKRAGDGFSYVYLACHLQQTYGAPDAADAPAAQAVQPAQLAGVPGVRSAKSQATRSGAHRCRLPPGTAPAIF